MTCPQLKVGFFETPISISAETMENRKSHQYQYQPKQWKLHTFHTFLGVASAILKWWRFSQLPWQPQNKSAGLWKFCLRGRDLLFFCKTLGRDLMVQSSWGNQRQQVYDCEKSLVL